MVQDSIVISFSEFDERFVQKVEGMREYDQELDEKKLNVFVTFE